MSLELMYITNRTDVAMVADKYGVDRVWIDLETLGKEARQKNFDSVKSHHTISDIEKIAPILKRAKMMVRVNPWNEGSKDEINAVINAGAELVMLPMWTTVSEADAFIDAVAGRAKVSLLLETIGAEKCLDEVLKLGNIDEIHIGLNDLHIQYGLKFMFELLANGKVEEIVRKISSSNIPYGFGGVGKVGEGTLPAESIIKEHYRLGSRQVILSRSFCNTDIITDINDIEAVFKGNISKFREYESKVSSLSQDEYSDNHRFVQECVRKIVGT